MRLELEYADIAWCLAYGMEKKCTTKNNWIAISDAIVISMGAAIGTATDTLGPWMGIGAAIATAMAVALER